MMRLILIMLLALPGITAWGDNAPVRLEDFAYAVDITTDGDAAIYQLELPQAVYKEAVRADLRDIRVFNAEGLPVPHGLVRTGQERAKSTTRYELPLFPLYADAAKDALNIRVRIERQEAGQSIQLEQSQMETGTRLSGYILDARKLSSPIRRLSFKWEEGDFLTRLDLEVGNDLEHWRTLIKGVTLADMQHLGHHLRRDQIKFKPVKTRYFRLRFADPDKAVVLTSAQAQGTHYTRITHYREATIEVRRGPEEGEYRFEIPPALPTDELRISLPEINALAGAALESRATSSKPWRLRRKLTLYRLRQHGVELENEDIQLSGSRERLWRLRVEQSTGGIGTGLPQLSLRWRAHELQFVARGEGPYTLAWGSAKPVPKEKLQPKGILKTTGLAPADARISGDIRRVAGDAVLSPQINWRQGLLWGVLVLAALLLVAMAVRLFRQMNG